MNEETEYDVLIACLMSGWYGKTDRLYPELFSNLGIPRKIYEKCEKIKKGSEQEVNLFTVSQLLEDYEKEALNKAIECSYYGVNALNIEAVNKMIKVLAELARKRHLLKSVDSIKTKLQDPTVTAASVAETFGTMMLATASKKAEEIKEFGEIVEQSIDRIRSRREGKIKQVKTGFVQMDNVIGGFCGGDLITLSGRAGTGKTAFALSIMSNICKAKPKAQIAMFSLEMTRHDLIDRMIASKAKINSGLLRSGKVRGVDWDAVLLNKEAMKQWNVHIDDSSSVTIYDIASKCRGLAYKHKKLELIIIDYLGLIDSTDKRAPRYISVSVMTKQLKDLAKELDTPILLLAQLNRNVDSRAIARPMLSDLRESGSIEQDSDMVIGLWEQTNESDLGQNSTTITATVMKNRHGPTADINFLFVKDLLVFAQLGGVDNDLF
jgi:replicative DNA helicase